MRHGTPPGYEKKFADFIKMCADLKAKGVKQVIVANPYALGDNYDEMIESLSRLADAGLSLHVAARAESI
jgi:dihydrodipicolinate synthase/N-acetylneuraminate lyase